MLEDAAMEYGLQARECSAFGATLTYASKQYPCSTGTIGFGGRFVGTGFAPGSDCIITLRKSVLDADFKVGQSMSVELRNGDSREFKIVSDGIRDCVYAWELTLNDPNQNA
jgi:hypothetical protein